MDMARHAGDLIISLSSGTNGGRVPLSFFLLISPPSPWRTRCCGSAPNSTLRAMARLPAHIDVWPVPELFFELVGDPAGLVSALLGDVGEHALPFGLIERASLGPAAFDQTEIAIEVGHVFRRTPGQEAAVRARLATSAQR